MSRKILFIQPFGVANPGGGPKILRSLLNEAPFEVLSIATSVHPPLISARQIKQIWIPIRPEFRFLEYTRFSKLLRLIEPLFYFRFYRRIKKEILKNNASSIHIIPHEHFDFWLAYKAAKRSGIKVYVSIHDDFRYYERKKITSDPYKKELNEIWNGAEWRFVISEEMGTEYCQRYGTKPFTVITDGVERLSSKRRIDLNAYKFYFCGLIHDSYLPNFERFITVLDRISLLKTTGFLIRGGLLRNETGSENFKPVFLPFAKDEEVFEDRKKVNLLYLPLPFDEKHSFLNRFSLSTKLIEYMRFGLPVVYHGPRGSALYNLLNQYDAAILITENDPDLIEKTVSELTEKELEIKLNNLQRLANERFLIDEIKSRFYEKLGG